MSRRGYGGVPRTLYTGQILYYYPLFFVDFVQHWFLFNLLVMSCLSNLNDETAKILKLMLSRVFDTWKVPLIRKLCSVEKVWILRQQCRTAGDFREMCDRPKENGFVL